MDLVGVRPPPGGASGNLQRGLRDHGRDLVGCFADALHDEADDCRQAVFSDGCVLSGFFGWVRVGVLFFSVGWVFVIRLFLLAGWVCHVRFGGPWPVGVVSLTGGVLIVAQGPGGGQDLARGRGRARLAAHYRHR